MSIVKKLQTLKLSKDAVITLRYEEGTDVFHFNETEVEDALNETNVVDEFAALIAHSNLDARNSYNGNIIEYLREQDYLEDYERGTYGFEEYLCETLSENFYDVDLISYSTEKYDHKRGFTTLTAEVEVPVENFIEVDPYISGWRVSVDTGYGVLSFDA